LIVCPLSVIGNWCEQIDKHVKTGVLSYHVYHGSGRIMDPAKLSEFDVVITTCECSTLFLFSTNLDGV
jgi:SWI/SNF-related matrix-associated actin-dependent regulator of chromatin subfamily A3